MRIGLDFDGVIANCGKLKSLALKAITGVEVPEGKFSHELIISEGYMTQEDYRSLQERIYNTTEFLYLMEPVIGAIEGVNQLLADGHEVMVVTSRSSLSLQIAQDWIADHIPNLSFTSVGYRKSKAEALSGVDFYIDDDLDKLEDLVGNVKNLYLFSWGYNAHLPCPSGIQRISNWDEIMQTIAEIRSTRN